MANAYSVPQNMGQHVDPINTNLVNTVLNAKQQSYDYNVSKIDNAIKEYTNLPLLRGKDKEYLKSKIDGVLEVVNSATKLSMSNRSTRQIEQAISASVDDEVLTQISNSKKIIDFEKSVAEKREKKPDLYSDVNYSYAKEMANVNQYMNEETDTIGSLQYVDYKDVKKRVNDFVLDIQNKRKDQIIEVPDGQGGVKQTTISGLNPFQIRQLAESQLDATYSKQIEIDGWRNAGGYNNPDRIKTNISTVFDVRVKERDAKLAELDSNYNDALSDEDKKEWHNQRDSIANSKTQLEKDKDFLLNNIPAAATFLERERVLVDAQDAFGSLYSENSKVVKDDLWFAQQDLNLKKLKLEHDIAKDNKTQKEALSGENSIVTTVPTELDNVVTDEQFISDTIKTTSGKLNTDIAAYKSALGEEVKKGNREAIALMDEYNKKLKLKKPGETDEDVFSSVISSKSYTDNISIIGNRNFISDIKESKDKLSMVLEARSLAVEKGKENHIDSTINNQATFSAFYNNPNTKMVWYKDGKISSASVRDVLISKGLMDRKTGKKLGDIKQHKDVLKTLERSYYASSIINNTDDLSRTTDWASLKKLADSFNENIKDIATDNRKFGRMVTFNPNTKTGQFIIEAKKNGVYDTWGFADNSLVGDDKTIGRFLSSDYKETETYKNSIKGFRDRLPTSQLVGIVPNDKSTHQLIRNMITTGFKPSADATINLRVEGDYVIASQAQSEKIDKVNQLVQKESKILKSDFMRNAPELANKLDFSTEASFYTIDKLQGRTLKTEPVKFYNTSTKKNLYNYTAQVTLNNNPDLVRYIDSTEARASLYSDNKILQQKYKDFGSIVDRAVSQSSNFSINATVERDFNNRPVLDVKLVDKRTQKVVHSISNSGDFDISNFKKILDSSPQVYYSMIVDDIFKREREEMMMGGESTTKSLQDLMTSLR